MDIIREPSRPMRARGLIVAGCLALSSMPGWAETAAPAPRQGATLTGAERYSEWLLAAIDRHAQALDIITRTATDAAHFYVDQQHVIRAEGDASAVGEVTGRSGGIIMMGLTTAARTGGRPLILYILREHDPDADLAGLRRHHHNGSHTVVFGRRQLLERLEQSGIPCTSMVDIQAAVHGGLMTDNEGNPVVSTVPTANALALWVWLSEFVAACTRLGAMPPIYEGYHTPGGKHRALRLTGIRFHREGDIEPIPEGVAGRQYLDRLRLKVETLVAQDLNSIRAVGRAAARRIAGIEPGNVYAFLHGHSILRKTPLAFDPGHFPQTNVGWNQWDETTALQVDDLILCIGYTQVFRGRQFADWDVRARQAGAIPAWAIALFLTEEIDAIQPGDYVIQQPWSFGDAIVTIPGYDVRMAPASGVLAEAIYGMHVAETQALLTEPDSLSAPLAGRMREQGHPRDAALPSAADTTAARMRKDDDRQLTGNMELTALHLAVHANRADQVSLLLAAGADLNAPDRFGRTPLHVAATRNLSGITGLLLASGADAGATDARGEIPLHRAARYGDADVVKALVAHAEPADKLLARDHLYRRTALHVAARFGNATAIRILAAAGAPVDATDRWGMQPIHLAAKNGQVDTLRGLLDHGASALAHDDWGRTVLHWAAQEHRLEALALLIQHGVSPNSRDRFGRTPLYDAAGVSANRTVLTLLLDAGADPAVRCNQGDRPTVGTWGWVGDLLDAAIKNQTNEPGDP